MILCFYRQEVETFKEEHKIIDVTLFFRPPFFPERFNLIQECVKENHKIIDVPIMILL